MLPVVGFAKTHVIYNHTLCVRDPTALHLGALRLAEAFARGHAGSY